jgi:hypothetical protein
VAQGRYRWREPGGVGTTLQVLVAASGLLSMGVAIAVAVWLGDRSLVFTVPAEGQSGAVEVPPEVVRWFGLLWIPSLVSQVTVVLWLVWHYQATANLWARGITGMRVTPGWAVGWWFIPFAWYVMPFLAVREVDERSTADGTPRRASPLVGWWWGAWIGAQLVPLIGMFGWGFSRIVDWARTVEDGATSVDLGPLVRPILPWIVVAGVLQAVAGILASRVVARIDRSQRAMTTAGPPAPPRPDLGW